MMNLGPQPSASSSETNHTPFWMAGGLLLVVAAAGIAASLARPELFGDQVFRIVCFCVSALVGVVAVWFLVWPSYLDAQTKNLRDLPSIMSELASHIANVDTIRREYSKSKSHFDSWTQAVTEQQAQLTEVRHDFVKTMLERKKIDAREMELREEDARKQKELEAWVQAAIEFYHTIEAALAHADLSPEYRKVWDRAARDFDLQVAPLGLACIRPEKAELFDDRIHTSTGSEPSADVSPGMVLRSKAWGFRVGGRIVKRAEVIVATPLTVSPPANVPTNAPAPVVVVTLPPQNEPAQRT